MDYQNLITFAMNIPDTDSYQMTLYVPTSLNVCFCTTWGKEKEAKYYIFVLFSIII